MSDVGSVACGSAHTLAVSKDGKMVWSFGLGDGGRLGHGEIAKVYRPQIIEALQGVVIQKVCAGAVFSLALTSTGQVSVTSSDSFYLYCRLIILLFVLHYYLWQLLQSSVLVRKYDIYCSLTESTTLKV